MSVKHIAWVWESSRAEGGTLLVALALADSVNNLRDDDECWPKRDRLAHMVRLSEGQVSRCLKELEDLGEIERRRTQNGNHYRLLMPDVRICAKRTHATSDVAPTPHSDVAPTLGPYVEPEVRTRKEPEDMQAALLPDPIDETWELYARLMERPRAVLTPKVRKWIRDAHEAVGVDRTHDAIRGLAASNYHRGSGYIGIEYALRPKQNETVEGRIEKMAALAPSVDGSATNEPDMLAKFDADTQESIYGLAHRIQLSIRQPNDERRRTMATEAYDQLRDRYSLRPTFSDEGRLLGWTQT